VRRRILTRSSSTCRTPSVSFDRLHPAVQHHVVNSLGWPALRPLQEQAIAPILDGEHALLLAPTAGGKTEAAALPLFSRMLSESWPPLSVLYVCPLRALLNNLETRLSYYGHLLGRTARLWHGDVTEGARREIRQDPPDLLLTTPESLEVMLVSRSVDCERMFGSLRAVVVDELHAFAGDDRGWHLLAVLERAARFAGVQLQRVGLSATIGNPEELLQWLAGESAGRRSVVAVSAGSATHVDVKVDYVGSLANAATVISRLHRGEKRLVFCDSRSRVEDLAYRLRELEVSTFVSHGSLGVTERRQAEAAFAEGRDCVIVSTSTLELGIDVGDLDRVIQIGAPKTVASFLQRIGRTGRRSDTTRNLLFLATDDDELLLASAIVRLWERGFVEPVTPPPGPLHVLAQQLLALTLQTRGLAFDAWPSWISGFVHAAQLEDQPEVLIRFMLGEGLLFESDGVLTLGPTGEARFSGKRFLDLLAVFLTPQLFTVLFGRQEIGKVDEASLQMKDNSTPVLLLGGKGWLVRHVDWERHEVFVEPAEQHGRSLWPGGVAALSYEVCQALRDVLTEKGPEDRLTQRAVAALARIREDWAFLDGEHTHLVRQRNRSTWWTFAGLRANALLSEALATQGIHVSSRTNLGLGLTTGDEMHLNAAVSALRVAGTAQLAPVSLAEEAVKDLKFGFCLPHPKAVAVLSARLSDPMGAENTMDRPISFTGDA
jgi:ATP-dependent Lhr-like helicase